MQTLRPLAHAIAVAVLCSSTLASADSGSIVRDSVRIEMYDGVSDDLLSAGLNQAGLVSAVPPPFADPNHPTAAELRRRAIYGNYRGIVDPVPGGGMGLLWGPQSPGTPVIPGATFGLIPGVEYQAYLRVRDAHGHVNNVPAAVQIPAHFNPAKPCLVAAVPSGSRSVWGGIAIAEWALFKGCAVALPGKGTDTGFHLLGKEAAAWAVDDLAGMYGSVAAIGEDAQFALRPSPALDAYVAANPYRIATKHAHSQLNPERLWGQFALEGIEFAFWALNDHFEKKGGKRFDRKNTLVIAAGASNGGGMALRALEEDGKGLIDGLVVTEPNIGPEDGRFVIRFGSRCAVRSGWPQPVRLDHAHERLRRLRSARARSSRHSADSGLYRAAGGRPAALPIPQGEGPDQRRYAGRAGRVGTRGDPRARVRRRPGLGHRVARHAEPLALAAADLRERLRALRDRGQPLRRELRRARMPGQPNADDRGERAQAVRRQLGRSRRRAAST